MRRASEPQRALRVSHTGGGGHAARESVLVDAAVGAQELALEKELSQIDERLALLGASPKSPRSLVAAKATGEPPHIQQAPSVAATGGSGGSAAMATAARAGARAARRSTPEEAPPSPAQPKLGAGTGGAKIAFGTRVEAFTPAPRSPVANRGGGRAVVEPPEPATSGTWNPEARRMALTPEMAAWQAGLNVKAPEEEAAEPTTPWVPAPGRATRRESSPPKAGAAAEGAERWARSKHVWAPEAVDVRVRDESVSESDGPAPPGATGVGIGGPPKALELDLVKAICGMELPCHVMPVNETSSAVPVMDSFRGLLKLVAPSAPAVAAAAVAADPKVPGAALLASPSPSWPARPGVRRGVSS